MIAVILAWAVAFIVGLFAGWNFAQAQGWGVFPSIIVALVFAAVAGRLASFVSAIFIVVKNGAEDRAFERRYSSTTRSRYAPASNSTGAPASAEAALDSIVQRMERERSGGAGDPGAGAHDLAAEQQRGKEFWDRVRGTDPLPPIK